MRNVGLTGRIVIGAAVIAIVFVSQLIVSFASLRSIHRANAQQERAAGSIVAAVRIEKLVLDLETGQRGYIITHDPQFLQPWRSAQRALPVQSRRLDTLDSGPTSKELERQWKSYLADWSIPIVHLAQRSNAIAAARVRSAEGKRRVDAIRRTVNGYVARQESVLRDARDDIDNSERTGRRLAVLGAGLRIGVFVLVLLWLFRSVVAPLRRVAFATRELGAGRLGIEVAESGAGEVGELSRAFNEMSRSVVDSRSALAAQNVDLERLANVLRAVLDSTVDGILLSDAEGYVQLANRPVINLTRDLDMSFEGTVVDRLLSVEHRIRDRDAYRAAMERLRSNPEEPTFDEFEDTVSGRVFQGFTSPVLDDRGGFLGRIWTLRDVTQERELDRLKDDFVATVSHELRTPLTSMMGFLEMIREGEAGPLNDEQRRFLSIVYRSSERLQRLVGDLLFVARLDANGLQLQFGDVYVEEAVAECVEASSALARSREIDLRAELDPVPPVRADKERLAQLVSNLLSNAIKFTPAGGTVTARTRVDRGEAVIQVEDTGIGIPEAEQNRLFQRFFRSSTATAQAIPGTGLGLVISKAIAEAHGGSISVASSDGAGTCFTVRLPLEREAVA